MRSFIKKYWLILLSFCVFACLSNIFIIHTHVLFSTDDLQFHLKRVMEIYSNNYFSPFAFNYFHGSSIMAMYPHYGLFPLVLILHFTTSYIKAYSYFFILIILVSQIVSFFSSLCFSKSSRVSYLFAILYSFSISYLINYFHDGDLGITISLVFLPLTIFGFLDVINGSRNFSKLALGITLMTMCQLPTTVITIAFLLMMFLLNITKINKDAFLNLVKSAILTIVLTAVIWIPLFKIVFFNHMYTPGSTQIQSASALSIIKNVGIFSIIIALFILFYLKRLNRTIKQMYCISIILIVISSTYVPMIRLLSSITALKFLNKFQFTARFLIIPQIILCYLSSWVIVKWLHHFRANHFKMSFIGIVLLILISQMSVQGFIVHKEFNQNYKYANSYRAINVGDLSNNYLIRNSWIKYLANGYINNKDYYPKDSVSRIKYINNNEATYDKNKIVHVKHNGNNRFSFNNSKKIRHLALPLLHYNDEHLRVYVNNHLVHYHVNGNNLITLNNVKKGRNVVGVRYVPNVWISILKNILFLIGIIWILEYVIFTKSEKRTLFKYLVHWCVPQFL